ncbi:MAG: alpha/beta fold hydrolase [Chloroflexi bacterium]|nr:alpha/beta fold hydrolase [Chloroflexota bacterium]
MKSEALFFPCGDIRLEGELLLPDVEPPFRAVVVCHPHPLYGGDMNNNIVTAACRGLLKYNLAAFRFNFRGVGASQGRHGNGDEEQHDATAALDLLSARSDIRKDGLGLCGYSFGGRVALKVAEKDERVKALALVSPALKAPDLPLLLKWPGPKLVMWGSADTHIAPVLDKAASANPRDFKIVPGADHFWSGYESHLAAAVPAFFMDALG